ncbi:LOW QUALITY PROTEIN: tektin-4 [Aplochiton taeniatus]
MSSEVLVSRPRFDSRAATHRESHHATETSAKDVLYPSSGLATAGYRTAKYTSEEWHMKNYSILHQAITEREEARRIRQKSKSLYTETEGRELWRTHATGTRHLGERLQDIHFWKSELQRHIEQLIVETDLLLSQRREKALHATEIPFIISSDNLTCRERRLGPDLVKDKVEEELLKEVELIRSVQALLQKTHNQAVNQIKNNWDAKLTGVDWSDKHQAYDLDDQCGRYNSMSTDTQHHPCSASNEDQVCNRDAWVRFTQDNLTLASQEEKASMELRRLMETVLQETAEDLRAQCATVDQAFNHRCLEVTQAKTKLELHLAQILEQIGAQEKNIVSLQQAISDKEAPLRVAQSRLYQRSHRPHMELCRDVPQLSLVGEVGEIGGTLSSLRQQLAEARGSLARLEDTRMVLEKDINVKNTSLLIDRDKMHGSPHRYPTIITLSGY